MSILFFTCANVPYEDFIPLYAFSTLCHVEEARLEFGVEDVAAFSSRHGRAIALIHEVHGNDRVKIRQVPWSTPTGGGIVPNTVRFINEPESAAQYVYIGDVDIIVLDRDLVAKHLNHMKNMKLPYSNSVRPGTQRMSGLHFAPMDVHYPLPDISDLDVGSMNDERLLYAMVKRKGLPVIDDHWFRPTHGIHISPNRPVLKSVDDKGNETPGWSIESHKKAWLEFSRKSSFRRLRGMLSQRVQSCLREIDRVVEDLERKSRSSLNEL
jgi:hypothetical protein